MIILRAVFELMFGMGPGIGPVVPSSPSNCCTCSSKVAPHVQATVLIAHAHEHKQGSIW